jgi:hypothetical protein
MRQRLGEVDEELIADEVRRAIRFAQTGEGDIARFPQRLMEAIQLAHDAARARKCLAESAPIPPRWLAALGGVATSRVRQLLREGVLRRSGNGVDVELAKAWLTQHQPASAKRVRAVAERRLVAVDPSWWRSRHWKGNFYFEFGEVIERLVPAGHRFGYDVGNKPFFEVLPGTMTVDELEENRARIRGELELLDPTKGGWTSPSGAAIYY